MTTTYEHKTELVGDDYHGLPTQPVKYRSKPSRTGIDWDKINADYVANGGQVDDTVWTNRAKVEVIEGSAASSRAAVHTFELADDYQEHVEPRQRNARPRSTAKRATPRVIKVPAERRPAIRARYEAGETIAAIASDLDVTPGSIRFAIQKAGGAIRSKAEASALSRGSKP